MKIKKSLSTLVIFLTIFVNFSFGQQTLIHNAIKAGDLVKVRTLLEADPKILEVKEGQRGQTPLFLACVERQFPIANFLIDKGANVKATDKYGYPLLSFAIKHGFPLSNSDMKEENECISLIQRLINKGADVNASHKNIGSPIHLATQTGNLKLAKLLIDQGANPNASYRHGTPMQSDIMFKDDPSENIVRLLLKNGAKIQEFNYGNNDLHLAVIKGYEGLVQAMVDHGADLNSVNDYGHTPLYYATRHGHHRTADVLITAGADKSTIVETNYGKSAQLSETLREGEAYLWYLGGTTPGTGYAVKTKNNLLIFDPDKVDNATEAGLANGKLSPEELEGQKITVFRTRKEIWTESIVNHFPEAEFVFGYKPEDNVIGPSGLIMHKQSIINKNSGTPLAFRLAKANENFSVSSMQIHTIQTRPSGFKGLGNLGYLVEVDGLKIFHAGILRSNNSTSQIERFRKEIDFLKPFGPIDFVILPVRGRHLDSFDYKQYFYLIDQLKPKAIYLIGDDMMHAEHLRCIEALKECGVPVFYPDGGVALGQRFHYSKSSSGQQLTDLYGDYLGQTPPGDTPVVFAPGFISRRSLEHGPAIFSADGNEVYWCSRKSAREWQKTNLWFMKRINNRWTKPEKLAPFGVEVAWMDPFLSRDGKRLYFSADANTIKEKGMSASENRDIWFVDKQDNGWSKPKKISTVINRINGQCQATLTHDGTVYFIEYKGEGKEWRCDILKSKLKKGKYLKPVVLPESINSPIKQKSLAWTPYIAPDDSYLIFASTRHRKYRDLYISFHDISNDRWSEPVGMGDAINTVTQESYPTVSPDGKYLFFTRYNYQNKSMDVYWVSTGIIEKLKEKVFNP